MSQKKKNYHEGIVLSSGDEFLGYSEFQSGKDLRETAVHLESIECFKDKHYLGYFTLQVLVVEEHLRKLLFRIGSILQREGKSITDGKDKLKELDALYSLTFGRLILYLKNYVDSEYLFSNEEIIFNEYKTNSLGLDDIHKLRDRIAHRLIYEEVEIKVLQERIIRLHSEENFQKILGMLGSIGLELTAREASSDYFKTRAILEKLDSSSYRDRLFRLKEF